MGNDARHDAERGAAQEVYQPADSGGNAYPFRPGPSGVPEVYLTKRDSYIFDSYGDPSRVPRLGLGYAAWIMRVFERVSSHKSVIILLIMPAPSSALAAWARFFYKTRCRGPTP